jgi:hypothetical protein
VNVTPRYVATEEISKLTAGSFENLTARVRTAVVADRKRLFGEDQSRLNVIATFPKRAIVASAAGNFVNVVFEETTSGTVMIVEHSSLTVPTIDESELPVFLRRQALKAVDALSIGNRSGARELVAGLLRAVPAKRPVVESTLLASIAGELQVEKPWQKILSARTAKIHTAIGEAVSLLQKGKLEPKFGQLYSGSITGAKLEGYRDLVRNDLGYLKSRVSALADLVESSVTAAKPVVAAADLGKDEAASLFNSFAEDLLLDTKRLVQIVTEGIIHLGGVDSQGRLYDAIVNRLHQQEVAGRFVFEMAKRLTSASRQ